MVQGAATTDGYALKKAFDRKVARVGEPCRQAGLAFIPWQLTPWVAGMVWQGNKCQNWLQLRPGRLVRLRR